MKEYSVIRKTSDEIDWSNVPELEINEVAWDKPAEGIEAKAQLCWDENALYVKLSAKEAFITANRTETLDFPNYDSCLEFFFSPVEDDSRYFNIEINPNCLMFQGLGHEVKDLVRFVPLFPNIFPKAERTVDGWSVSYSVSKEYITEFFPTFEFKEGAVIRANFYKCGDECKVPHYYSWNPMTIETPCFHYPPDFGKLILK